MCKWSHLKNRPLIGWHNIRVSNWLMFAKTWMYGPFMRAKFQLKMNTEYIVGLQCEWNSDISLRNLKRFVDRLRHRVELFMNGKSRQKYVHRRKNAHECFLKCTWRKFRMSMAVRGWSIVLSFFSKYFISWYISH